MGLTLYDISGKNKIVLNLVKAVEPPPNFNLEKDFQFLGARTKLYSTFKVGGQRELVGPDDWFYFTEGGWKKIKTGKEVDEYVQGSIEAPLLVIERMGHEGGSAVLHGTLYNSSRSQAIDVDLPLKPHAVSVPKEAEKGVNEKKPDGKGG